MHADGSIGVPLYVAPKGVQAERNGAGLPAKAIYALTTTN